MGSVMNRITLIHQESSGVSNAKKLFRLKISLLMISRKTKCANYGPCLKLMEINSDGLIQPQSTALHRFCGREEGDSPSPLSA